MSKKCELIENNKNQHNNDTAVQAPAYSGRILLNNQMCAVVSRSECEQRVVFAGPSPGSPISTQLNKAAGHNFAE